MEDCNKIIYGGLITSTALIFAGAVNYTIANKFQHRAILAYLIVILILLYLLYQHTKNIQEFAQSRESNSSQATHNRN